MTITSSDFASYKSATVNDTSANGGRMNMAQPITSAVLENLFANIPSAELTAGSTKWRKMYKKLEDTEEGYMQNVGVHLRDQVQGDGAAYLVKGDWEDTQGSMTFSDKYGSGTLAASVTAGATQLTVTVEDPAVTIYRAGDRIWITDGTNIEYKTIDTGGVSGPSGSVYTLDLTEALVNSYSLGVTTEISSLVEYGTVQTSVNTATVTTGDSGTADTAQLTLPNEGCEYQVWTLTFTTATAFDLTGDSISGSPIASGTVGVEFSPSNPNTSSAYFVIPASGFFGGTFQAADTVVFTTTPAGCPIWIQRVIPSSATAEANQTAKLRLYGAAA